MVNSRHVNRSVATMSQALLERCQKARSSREPQGQRFVNGQVIRNGCRKLGGSQQASRPPADRGFPA